MKQLKVAAHYVNGCVGGDGGSAAAAAAATTTLASAIASVTDGQTQPDDCLS